MTDQPVDPNVDYVLEKVKGTTAGNLLFWFFLGVGVLALSLTQTGFGPARGWRPSPGGTAFGAMLVVGGLLWKRER